MTIKRMRTFDWIMPTFAFVAITCLALRVATWRIYPHFSYEHHLFPTHLRADSLFYGVLISYFYHYHPERLPFLRWKSRYLVLAAVILLAPAFVLPVGTFWIVPVLFLSIFYIGAGFALVAALRLTTVTSRFLQLFRTLGATSYSIYLWHESVNSLARSVVHMTLHRSNWYLETAAYLVGACAFGYVAARLVEIPALALRNRLFPSPVPSPPEVTQ